MDGNYTFYIPFNKNGEKNEKAEKEKVWEKFLSSVSKYNDDYWNIVWYIPKDTGNGNRK